MGEQGSAAEKGPAAAAAGGISVEECDDMIQKSLKTPTVKFLRERLAKAGCSVGPDMIRAVTCDKQITGGYVPGKGIIVCSNNMRSQDDVNQVVKHKLINAYDDCRAANLNWANCAHHACSEIRANHLSGDCHYKRELLRGNVKIRGHEQECVRRRVLKAVAANPHCSEVAASDAMDAVWDICYNDTQPFDRAP
ncbi:hypothetical protein MLD38_029544 [Melastoma candidum]|uniref:Uncharacterized protein n=1 Tax=Melastoma candidum TaxID=119954 RepID=A0ACB9N8A2_9MYRT|nr:hypothetical protein MLD38_029544 [Melastoma candidum]